MRYQKGSFVVVPNKQELKGRSSFFRSIYLAICDYTDEDGICYPSMAKIAKDSGCSVRMVQMTIKEMESQGFLEKTFRKNSEKPTQNLSNLYQLMIIEEGGVVHGMHQTGAQQDTGVVHGMHPEQNIVLTNPINNIDEKEKNKKFADLMDQFKSVNPMHSRLFANKAQRAALQGLVDKFGMDEVRNMITAAAASFGQPFAPTITTPIELSNKLGALTAFLKKNTTSRVAEI